jgi:hypothetical protein
MVGLMPFQTKNIDPMNVINMGLIGIWDLSVVKDFMVVSHPKSENSGFNLELYHLCKSMQGRATI